MPFDLGVNGATRLTSGVTPYLVFRAMAQKVKNARIVDSSRVWMVLDDEKVPAEQPPDNRFITVRYPSGVPYAGDVFGGDVNSAPLSRLMCEGQTRHTIWLSSERDLYGTADSLVDDVLAQEPEGGQLLGQMIKLFWQQDLVDDAGDALTNCPMRLISWEMPPDLPSLGTARPFRITWEIKFTWDLSKGG